MQKLIALALVTVMLTSTVGLAPLGAAAPTDTADNPEAIDQSKTQNNTTTPGKKLSGVVEVQQTELNAAVEEREFGIRVAQSKTPNGTAKVVDERLEKIEQRIKKLEERKEKLKERHENGSISDAKYKAKMASLAAKSNHLEEMANKSKKVAKGLPKKVLHDNGVNVTAIKKLKQNAHNMSGKEVRQIAHQIAGPNIGKDVPGKAKKGNDGKAKKGNDGKAKGQNKTKKGEGETPPGNSEQGNSSTTASPNKGGNRGDDHRSGSTGNSTETRATDEN